MGLGICRSPDAMWFPLRYWLDGRPRRARAQWACLVASRDRGSCERWQRQRPAVSCYVQSSLRYLYLAHVSRQVQRARPRRSAVPAARGGWRGVWPWRRVPSVNRTRHSGGGDQAAQAPASVLATTFPAPTTKPCPTRSSERLCTRTYRQGLQLRDRRAVGLMHDHRLHSEPVVRRFSGSPTPSPCSLTVKL
eukprot:6828614-Prymnesium_polylepis.1